MARQKWTCGDYAQQSERTKRQKYDARVQLQHLGISERDADKLLRAANKLHRWHELECGTDRGAIERREDGSVWFYNYLARNPDWMPYWGQDYETIARRWINEIMAQHPTLDYYIQGDPRGCSLYILRPGDVPEGKRADAYYSRGIAVYKE